MTKYTSGDAKWYFKHIPVYPGKSYIFADYYRSDVPTTVTLEYKSVTGQFSYVDLGVLPSATEWTQYKGTFIPPSNTATVSVFHHISRIGYLNTDNFTLSLAQPVENTDITPPIISLSPPYSSTGVFSGSLLLIARATDNVGISGVTFLIDGIAVGSGIQSPDSKDSYTLFVDSTKLINGTHTIYAKAYDAANNSGSSTNISITTNNPLPDTEIPRISITSPV